MQNAASMIFALGSLAERDSTFDQLHNIKDEKYSSDDNAHRQQTLHKNYIMEI